MNLLRRMDCLFPRFTFSDPGSKPQMDCQNQEYFIVVPEQVYTNLLASLLGYVTWWWTCLPAF